MYSMRKLGYKQHKKKNNEEKYGSLPTTITHLTEC